jgi:hypothetical protein
LAGVAGGFLSLAPAENHPLRLMGPPCFWPGISSLPLGAKNHPIPSLFWQSDLLREKYLQTLSVTTLKK